MDDFISKSFLIAVAVILGITFFAGDGKTSVKTSIGDLLSTSSTQIAELPGKLK